MIFNIPFLISYISSIMTLNPGDLISTGTPAGIAPMKPGDTIEVKIEQIGTLKNRVVAP
jgi:2-keto-4-pentenoate hydratase/2-oxohepta-3-ene-1,7-dioic acid hydratase in catechol pathway